MGEPKARKTVGRIVELEARLSKAAKEAKCSRSKCRAITEGARLQRRKIDVPLYRAAKDRPTRRCLRKLKEDLEKALKLVKKCKKRSVGTTTRDRIDAVTKRIQSWDKQLIHTTQVKQKKKKIAHHDKQIAHQNKKLSHRNKQPACAAGPVLLAVGTAVR